MASLLIRKGERAIPMITYSTGEYTVVGQINVITPKLVQHASLCLWPGEWGNAPGHASNTCLKCYVVCFDDHP